MRIGLVGLGRQMTEVLAGALVAVPESRIAAVCDVDPARIDEFARVHAAPSRHTDASTMFASEELDAVIVAIGHRQNLPVLEAALRAGVSAFVEKTPVATSADARFLAELQEETGRYVMVGFNRRFTDDNQRAAAILGSEEFGGAQLFQSQFHATKYGEESFKLNHIIHHLDLARFLLGELELTHAQRVRAADGLIGYTIAFRAESGAIGTIQAGSMLDPGYPVERLEILGIGGNIVVDERGLVHNPAPGTRVEAVSATSQASAGEWVSSSYRPPHRNLLGYEDELRHFLDSVRANRRPSPDIADAEKTLRLVERLDELL